MPSLEADVLLGERYRLVRRIASGGMGIVWEAEDTVLQRPVAVKVLSDVLASDPAFVERFRREARAAAGLSHPNVAGVFDYGEDQEPNASGEPTHVGYIVMELLAGETLAERLRRDGRVPASEAAEIAAETAEALEAAHRTGLVHRDVKPANVMLTPGGRVKVMDFGIAAAGEQQQALTTTGNLIGTAGYLAPERVAGGPASPASDVYALGVVLYQMLTGHAPYEAETPLALAMAHVSNPIPRVADDLPDVPANVAETCERALAKDPAERPASAAAFASALRSPRAEGAAGGAGGEARPGADETVVLPPGGGAGATMVLDGASAGAGAAATTEVAPAAARGVPSSPSPPARRRSRWPALLAVLLLVGIVAFAIAHAVGGSGSSAGPVTVPVLHGLTVDAAEKKLLAVDLTPGPVQTTTSGRPGLVSYAKPSGGNVVPAGTTVTLYVGASATPSPSPSPSPSASPTPSDGGKGKDHGHGKGKQGD